MATLDVIRTMTIRAKTEGVDQARAAVTGLGTATDASARRMLSQEAALARLERQYIAGAKQAQEFERIQRQLNIITAQQPQLQEQANAVLAAAAQRLGQTVGATDRLVAGLSSVNNASRIMVAGMTAAGVAADKTTKSLRELAAEATAASSQMVSGMSQFGRTALESSVATDKLSAGMSAAGRQAAGLNEQLQRVVATSQSMIAGMSKIGAATLQSSVATQKLTEGLSEAGRQAALPKELDRVAAGMSAATDSSRLLIQGMSAYGQRAEASTKKTEDLTKSHKAARFELLNLSRQVQDVAVGLTSGQALFTVLIQQGSQIVDVFQSASLSGRSLGKTILDMITPFRVAAVGIVGLGVATALLIRSLAQVEVKLLDLTEHFNAPIEQLRALQTVFAGRGISADEFFKNMEGIADEVDRASRGLGGLAELFRRNGKHAGDLEKDLENIADLVKNAASKQDQFRILQEAGLQPSAALVRLFKDGGTALADQVQYAKSLSERNEQFAKQAQAFNDAWSKAWDNFQRNARNAAEATLSFFGKLITKAGEFVQANQIRVLQARGFTPEQALGELGRQALGAGAGVEMMNDEAQKFYNNIRGAGEKIDGIKTKTNQTGSELLALEQQRAQILGNIISQEEAIKVKVDAITEARIKGVQLSETEFATLQKIIRLQEISRRSNERVGVLGDTATEAERYAASIDALRVKLADTTINQADFDRVALATQPTIKLLRDGITDFGNSMVTAFIQGQDAAQALQSSLRALSASFATSALKDLSNIALKAITGGSVGDTVGLTTGATSAAAILTSAGATVGASMVAGATEAAGILKISVPAASLALPTAAAAAGTEVAAGGATAGASLVAAGTTAGAALQGPILALLAAGAAFAASKFFGGGDSTEDSEAQQRQQELASTGQALVQANEALGKVIDSFRKFTDLAEGPVTSALENAADQFQGLTNSAEAAKAAAAVFGSKSGAGSAGAAQAAADFERANEAIRQGQRQLDEFNRRTIETARAAFRGSAALSDIGKQIKDLNDQADDLKLAMQHAGESVAYAADQINDDLRAALRHLADQIQNDLVKQINQLTGKGFLNDLTELFQTINDAASIGVDQNTLRDFLVAKAQDIVNSAQITGQAFEDLLKQFPQLAGSVRQFGDTVDAVTERASSLSDRLFTALNDTSTLQGALAAFDRNAQIEREQELELGGANIILLEETLMAERLNVIKEFEQRAIEEEQRAAKEREDAINSAAKNIADYLNDLLAGSESTLSPQQRLMQAQTIYNAQLALAQTGDVDAQQNITKYAEDLRTAARDFYASGAQYQDIFNQITSDLASLPAVSEATDAVTQALINSILPAIQGTTSAVTGTTSAVTGTTSAVNTTTSTVSSGTTTLSSDLTTQTGVMNLVKASTDATTAQVTTANSLQSSANSLQTTANSILNSINTLTSTQQATLSSIDTSSLILFSIEGLLREVRDYIIDIKDNALAHIDAHTGHMFAPGGSIQFFLASGGWVPGAMPASKPFYRAAGGAIGTDTVPAMLTPGEFVVRNSVARANSSWLPMFNATGKYPANDNTAAFDYLANRLERALAGAAMAEIDANKTAIAVLSVQIERLTRAVAANKPAPTPRGTKTVSVGGGNR